jgi:hypothetical protein
MTGKFSVYEYFSTELYREVLTLVDAATAVREALRLTKSPGAVVGTTLRVTITDSKGRCCFEWIHGEGIVFPPGAGGGMK